MLQKMWAIGFSNTSANMSLFQKEMRDRKKKGRHGKIKVRERKAGRKGGKEIGRKEKEF